MSWKYLDENNLKSNHNIHRKLRQAHQGLMIKLAEPQSDKLIQFYGVNEFVDSFFSLSILDPLFNDFSKDIIPLYELRKERKEKFKI